MRIVFQFASLLLILAGRCLSDDATQHVFRIGNGVTAPKVLNKVEPKYSEEARHAGIQGTVVLELVVSEGGRAVNISVLSPLGFGLDEKALEAVEKWRFEPALKEGKPVPVLATVQVNFRLLKTSFDEKAEAHRTRFNVALSGLKDQNKELREKTIHTIEDLAKRNFPPAKYLMGKLTAAGDDIPKQ